MQAAIGDTEKKLEALEKAQEDVAKAFERGDLEKISTWLFSGRWRKPVGY